MGSGGSKFGDGVILGTKSALGHPVEWRGMVIEVGTRKREAGLSTGWCARSGVRDLGLGVLRDRMTGRAVGAARRSSASVNV